MTGDMNVKRKPEFHELIHAGENLSYFLEYKKVKNVNLRIYADHKIFVSAPPWVPVTEIDRFVLSKKAFISRAFAQLQTENPTPPPIPQYVSGEAFFFLGRSLILKVLKGDPASVFADEHFLYLILPNTENIQQKKALWDQFWLAQCQKIFYRAAVKIHRSFQKYGVVFPQIRIKTLRSKWGSCNPQKGIVTLNAHLLKYSPECIEYVVWHEFCHFIQPNHSKAFYALLENFVPDWKQYREELKQPR